ncbi:MAG: hypothetical protein V3S83_12580 [Gemmatimonadota bacterium]
MAHVQGGVQGAQQGASAGPAGALIGGVVGVAGGLIQERADRRTRRRQRKAIGAAQAFAKETVERITASKLFSGARSFLEETFENAADSPLARDFGKSIRQAQSVRGTFAGNLGAIQESIGTSAFSQRLRQSLLPAAQQFAFAPEQLRLQILQTEAPLRVAAATGAGLPGLGRPNIGSQLGGALSQGLSGAAGGFQLGRQIDFNQQLHDLRTQQVGRGVQADQPLDFGFSREALNQRIAAAGTVA